MSKNNNQLSLVEQAQASARMHTNFENAVDIHLGKSAFEAKQDTDGNEYVSATFRLLAPTKDHSEIVVNDLPLATKLEKLRRLSAMGEVSSFAICRVLADIADTEASSLGFDSTEALANAILAKGKSTLANYKRIGLYFVNDDCTLRGAIPQECSISLLNQLLSFVTKENEAGEPDIANVECLFKYAILTPYMKQAVYKKVIATLANMKSEKELKDMTSEEVEVFKKTLSALLSEKPAPKKKEVEQEQEQEQEQANITSDDPKVIIAQSLHMVHEMVQTLPKIGLSEEQANLMVTWLENITSVYTDILG